MAAILSDPLPANELALESGRNLRDHLAVLSRRRGLAWSVGGGLLAIAILVAVVLPPVYRSTATILIKEQEIPQELVRSTVTSFADERIQVISQQVMTRATLLDMVDKYGLYGKLRQRETSEEILDRMRSDIKLTPISADVTDRRTGSPVKSTIAFTLSYDSAVAGNAQKIANELTTLFLNENVKNRQQKAAETTTFLDEELVRVSDHVSELEKQLSDYKLKNQGRTPDLSQTNQVGSERTYDDQQRVEREIAFLGERRESLKRQLAQTKPNLAVQGAAGAIADPQDRLVALQSQLAGLVGTYSEEHPDIKRLRREIANLKAQTGLTDDSADRLAKLEELRAQISVLQQKYGDEYPDLVRLRRTYATLESAVKADGGAAAREARLKDLQAQLAELHRKYPQGNPELTRLESTYTVLDGAVKAGAAAGTAARKDFTPIKRKPDNPVYTNLQDELDTVSAQLLSTQSESAAVRQRLEKFDSRLSETPEAEREFLELARDLDSSRARFKELREKQMQAQVAEQLERERKAERFTLIEPPIYPEKPVRPNRVLILMLGLALALLGGIGTPLAREAFDRSVHSVRDAVRTLQVPVLARLPLPIDPARVRRGKLRMRWAIGAGVLLVALAVIAFHFLYMPLDVAWYGLLRRIYN
ncbi:MAG: GNVR domain-containing protein [Burkholderiaceae bacterium]